MADLDLSFACWDYDRTRSLIDGSVKPEGINLRYLRVFPAENFQRMMKFREFDVGEIGFKFYLSSLFTPERPLIAIPVFPLRVFRHSAIFINTNTGIERPQDLAGKRIGEPFAYGHDAAIWARGMLADEYGIQPDSCAYYVGAIDHAMKRDFAPFKPSANIRVEPLKAGQSLDAMLDNGEIDALYSALTPPSFTRGSPNVRRLFPDYERAERDYFRKSGIFPIMHLVAMRRDVYEKNRWIARELARALNEAKARALADYQRWSQAMNVNFAIPWLTAHLGENHATFGDDPWPYGLAANRKTLEAFVRYHHEQGLSPRVLPIEELFAPESLQDYSHF